MDLTVCWQDQRLIFGPLNTVYQELERYSTIAKLWNELDASPQEEVLWLGEEGYGPLVFQSKTKRPYGADCYNLSVERDILGYPKIITLE